MRHALIALHLVHQARDAASTEAEAGRRLEHQAQAKAGRSARSLGVPAGTPEVEDLARLLLAVGPGGALARAAEGEAFRDELMEETNVALAQRLLRGLPGHDARGGAP